MLDHIILTVSDIERSLAFYEAALKPLHIKFFMPYKGEDGHPDLGGFGQRLVLQTGSDHHARRRLDRPQGSADLSRPSGGGRRVQNPLAAAPCSPPSERPWGAARAPG
jgi:catechol 2,3-dioxygenase-like lactoylglutathione lyase family enzyme